MGVFGLISVFWIDGCFGWVGFLFQGVLNGCL